MSGYNREQIEAMLAKYGDMVYRMAIIQVKKQDLAEDIYQTVWLRLLQQKKTIEPEEHLKAWLLTGFLEVKRIYHECYGCCGRL